MHERRWNKQNERLSRLELEKFRCRSFDNCVYALSSMVIGITKSINPVNVLDSNDLPKDEEMRSKQFSDPNVYEF